MYKARMGHCNVPTGWAEDKQLAAWVVTKRQKKCDFPKSAITQERIDKLEALGLNWVPPKTLGLGGYFRNISN